MIKYLIIAFVHILYCTITIINGDVLEKKIPGVFPVSRYILVGPTAGGRRNVTRIIDLLEIVKLAKADFILKARPKNVR